MYKDLSATYKGKKVFVTGHTGFKGAWMLKTLSLLGAEISGYSLAPESQADLYNLLEGDTLCDSLIGDLRDRETLVDRIVGFQPDFIFHLAAQPLVRLSYEIPADTFAVNAIGTANVLDAVRQLDKPCHVVLITTDKVYHNNESIYPYRETDRLGGFDPYSASKACAELVIDSYRNSFFNVKDFAGHGKAIASARAGNVIGGGDWARDRLIPDIVRAISSNEKIIIRNPDSVRPWQHVLEPVLGYLLLGEKVFSDPTRFADAFNFGPDSNDALPVRNMVRLAIDAWGEGDFEVQSSGAGPHEAGLLTLDINKARSELNWRPKLDATQAISMTIDWYKQYLEGDTDIIAFTENQIKHFIDE